MDLKINRKICGNDVMVGLTAAIAGILDGMASAALAWVNPVYGLYNLTVGTPIDALFTSSVHMAVINTGAIAWLSSTRWHPIPEKSRSTLGLNLAVPTSSTVFLSPHSQNVIERQDLKCMGSFAMRLGVE